MGVTLQIGGTDFTNYVVSSERSHKLCKPISILTIELAPDLPRDITTYEDVSFYENGVKVFTGYTQSLAKARLPVKTTLSCSDVLVKTKDTWLIDQLVSNGETVDHWVGEFLKTSGIYNYSLESDQQVYPGYGWQYITAMDAITGTLKMTKYQIFADRNGKVWLKSIQKDTSPSTTISEYIHYERERNDSWIRNRAVVIGVGDNVADKTVSNSYIPDETRAVVIATGTIYNAATAWQIVEDMLEEFASPLDIKSITIPGDPNLSVGQTIRFIDSWSGYDSNCLITSLTSEYAADGYITKLRLDEKCINFWGWDSPPPEYIIMYAGTWGHGVYKSVTTGSTWSPTALTNKYIYDIAVISDTDVWAAGNSGVYHTINAGDLWTTQTMGAPVGQTPEENYIEADMYFPAVVYANSDSNTVYVLAGCKLGSGIWVYYTTNAGTSWLNVRIA